MSLSKRPVNKHSEWKPEPLYILEKYYKQSIKSLGKATVVDKAVLAYLDDGGHADTNFQSFASEEEHAVCLKKWMDKVSKYFDVNKSVRMPFGFGFYLLNALDSEDRKSCETELSAWQKKGNPLTEDSLLQFISAVNRESAEAVEHALQLVEKQSAESLVRARKEIDEAIHSLEQLKSKISN